MASQICTGSCLKPLMLTAVDTVKAVNCVSLHWLTKWWTQKANQARVAAIIGGWYAWMFQLSEESHTSHTAVPKSDVWASVFFFFLFFMPSSNIHCSAHQPGTSSATNCRETVQGTKPASPRPPGTHPSECLHACFHSYSGLGCGGSSPSSRAPWTWSQTGCWGGRWSVRTIKGKVLASVVFWQRRVGVSGRPCHVPGELHQGAGQQEGIVDLLPIQIWEDCGQAGANVVHNHVLE